jgi:tetratricopeptide (TPR) repeat protein
MADLLTTALQMHQAGQLGPAARLYQQILADEQENADAIHLLGVLRYQQGEHREAIELIGRAVALRPNVAAFHANLAEAYRALGQLERAVGCCRTAVRLSPDYPEGHNNLGLALQGLDRHTDAAEHFRRALQLRPDFALAHNNLGMSLRELKEFDPALSHFRRAVELAPQFAAALTNLGQMLLERGHAEEALPYCREAVRLQPDVAALHHNLGNALRGLKQLTQAKAEYLEAVRLDGNLAQAHSRLGLVLQREGRLDDALVWMRQAVELKPENADFWEHLAELYDEREESAESLPCWERVVELEPTRASAHLGLGWALQEEGWPTEAGEHYRKALRMQPDLATAQLNLGGLHEETGEAVEAETAFREALRLQASFAMPHARLAMLLRGKLPDSDCAALEARLADPDLGQGPRARLLFALAHVLDARQDYAAAAEHLRRANSLALELARGRREYAPAEHQRFIEGLVRVFGAEYFARLAGAGLPTRRPVFVFGLPRSGTTLVEQMLASHSRVYGAGELRLGRQSFEAVPGILGRAAPSLDCIAHLDSAALRRLAKQHEERLQTLAAPQGSPCGAGLVDTEAGGADRGQDAGQLPIPGPPGGAVPASGLHPLSPRSARRGRVVLDDRFSQHPLGQRL